MTLYRLNKCAADGNHVNTAAPIVANADACSGAIWTPAIVPIAQMTLTSAPR